MKLASKRYQEYRLARVMASYYTEGDMTFDQIARLFGYSRRYVRSLIGKYQAGYWSDTFVASFESTYMHEPLTD